MYCRLGFHSLVGILSCVLLTVSLLPAPAAEIKVVTEYIYPTAYEVTPITGTDRNGNTTIIGGIVTPTDFEMREVGVHMVVEAAIGNLGGGVINIAIRGQDRLDGSTDLMLAATAGDTARVRKLLAGRADVNAQNGFGSTALMGAAAGGFDDAVKLLLDRKADVNLRSKDSSTALLFAARNGHLDVVKRLQASGARLDDADAEGMTPLMAAAKGGYTDVVEFLTQHGASTQATDRNGRTALTLASARQGPGAAKLVLTLSARK
jgi:hypothetical protein